MDENYPDLTKQKLPILKSGVIYVDSSKAAIECSNKKAKYNRDRWLKG